MTDRIVQLIDKDNNNIYPVASVANAANITMTDTDPGEGSPLDAGNYIAVYGQDGYVETADIADGAVTADKTDFGGNYSTTEVDTGFTWIDGKHIYKKTCQFAVTSRSMQVAHGISSLATMIKVEGVWSTGNGVFQPVNRNAADQNTQQYNTGLGDIGSTYFLFQLGSGMAVGGQGLITFYYTKSA